MRTCDAIGSDLVLIGYTAKPIGKTLKMIKKTSIGAEDTVKWEHFGHFTEVIKKYPDYTHIAVEISSNSENMFDFLKNKKVDWNKTILWFGNELYGLERDLISKLNHELHLPMLGMKESLNVASTVCTAGYLFLEHTN